MTHQPLTVRDIISGLEDPMARFQNPRIERRADVARPYWFIRASVFQLAQKWYRGGTSGTDLARLATLPKKSYSALLTQSISDDMLGL